MHTHEHYQSQREESRISLNLEKTPELRGEKDNIVTDRLIKDGPEGLLADAVTDQGFTLRREWIIGPRDRVLR